MVQQKKEDDQVYFAIFRKNDKPLYGYNTLNEEAIHNAKRHLWSSYPFILKSGNSYYYKVKKFGYRLLEETDFILVAKKTAETEISPAEWELYGLKPICLSNGQCTDRCTVLRRLHYTFMPPTRRDYLNYMNPVEMDREPAI